MSLQERGSKMKRAIFAVSGAILFCAGCTNTITHYDENGKIIRKEETTNFSRAMDGTNSKSQIILVDGLFTKSDISVTAGEGCTPGWLLTFASGKTAVVNAKDRSTFSGCSAVVKEFFQTVELTRDGIKTSK